MPVLYVHGVNTRSREGFFAIEPLLRRHVAPAIAADASRVLIDDYYWGDKAVQFAWNGASRPRTQLIGQGTMPSATLLARSLAADDNRAALKTVPSAGATATVASASELYAPGAAHAPVAAMPALSSFTEDELADLVSALVGASPGEAATLSEAQAKAAGAKRAQLIIAADVVTRDKATFAALVGQSPEQQVATLTERLRSVVEATDELAGQGFSDVWAGFKERLGEALDRGDDRLGYAVSVVLSELRPKLHELLSVFIGDVFVYLHGRDNPASHPGQILSGLIEKLKVLDACRNADDEPLIVLTHSMGGQLVWDCVSSLLTANEATARIKIDFWCATASQVGFFEEAKLFLASSPNYRTGSPVPFPHTHLGVWWNVWDYNDVLSFTAKDICAGVDDGPYSSGKSLVSAHGGYLQRASLFRELGEKIQNAKTSGFATP